MCIDRLLPFDASDKAPWDVLPRGFFHGFYTPSVTARTDVKFGSSESYFPKKIFFFQSLTHDKVQLSAPQNLRLG
jgi:hypothetical protein